MDLPTNIKLACNKKMQIHKAKGTLVNRLTNLPENFVNLETGSYSLLR